MNWPSLPICLFAALFVCGCRPSGTPGRMARSAPELNDSTVQSFARSIARSVVNGDPDMLDSAFDREYLKTAVSEDPVVYSSFDIPEGQSYFQAGLRQGTLAVEAVDSGGDFAFVRHYVQDGCHHIVFRTYCDYSLSFADYIVDTAEGRMKIRDGFIYHTGSTLSENLKSAMLYNLLLQTDPNGETQNLNRAELLTRNGRHREALKVLKENKPELKGYRLYWQLYIANLYKTDSRHFIRNLDALAQDSLDARYLLLHKLLYYVNAGKPDQVEAVTESLIPYSGDDPIYLLFLARSMIGCRQYRRAAEVLDIAGQSLPLLWDLWYSQLECYRALDCRPEFDSCLQKGLDAYGMTPQELDRMSAQFWNGRK